MARVTRSKKIIIAEDDTQIAAQIPLPDTPGGPRRALGEIHNPEEAMTIEDVEMASQLKGLKAAYKTAIGVKKKNKGKKGKKIKQEQTSEENGESQAVLDDRQVAVVSPATSEAREILSSDSEHKSPTEEKQTSLPTAAVRATRRQLAANVQPANEKNINIDLDTSTATRTSQVDKDGDIIMHLPKKSPISTLEEVEKSCQVQGSNLQTADITKEDSFVEQITLRSPAKPAPRIEDSVEELDKMAEIEEALHEVTMAEQKVAEQSTKPFVSRERSQAAAARVIAGTTTIVRPSSLKVKSTEALKTIAALEKTVIAEKKSKPSPKVRPASTIVTSETSESKASLSKKLAKRPSSLLPPKQPVKAARPVTVSTFELPGEAIARRLKEQREARQAQRELGTNETPAALSGTLKIKSSKVPTKPTFELPGEAVSRRKREAHDARLRAQEEEEKKRREFKAKPLRKSILPDVVPRDTIASRARKSQIGLPEQDALTTSHSYSNLTASQRGSIVGAHRPSIPATDLANISAPRSGLNATHSSLERKPSTTNGPSMSGLAKQRIVSTTDAQTQRQRAKEIYNRDIKALEDIERDKRERETAAKKSREEAAERGRQASREWAEKQRARKAAEGDKGLSAGFGPGGQIGLKA